MCRDEQLFSSYFQQISEHRESVVVDDETADANHIPSNEGTKRPSSNGSKTQKGCRYSPVVQSKDGQTKAANDLLHDLPADGLRNMSDSEDEKRTRKKCIRYTPFKLTDGCPVWNVRVVFGSRELFMKALRQYIVAPKRPVDAARNYTTKLRIKCHGVGCEWYIYLRKTKAYNGIDCVLLGMQREHAHICSEVWENKWITSRWLAECFTEKIQSTSTHLYAGFKTVCG
ncbi:hypothetical protein AAHA92_14586 [Salvia divinorum]|uniref:Transposase MuDR plant domain-containing protein n=1 Tax=Salvia divinorum TaxID=28513 RepID=A0ABD1HG22_SALDI